MKSNPLVAKAAVIHLILLFSLSIQSQAPFWTWARNYGVISYFTTIGQNICTDGDGNLLLAGHYQGPTIAFGTTTLTNTSYQPQYSSDAYLVKHDAAGNVLWAKSFGCSGNDAIFGLCVDANNNIFITGTFIETSGNIFGMVLDSYTITSQGGGGDMFLAKLDPNGNVLWVQSAGGSSTESGVSLCTDGAGAVYVAGSSSSPSFNVSSASFSSKGATDFFVAKYSASGNLIWARQGGGTFSDYANSIAVDTTGNVIVGGHFQGVMFVGIQSFTNTVPTNSTDAFVAKFDASGNLLWLVKTDGLGNDAIQSLSTDANNNILVTGSFSSPILICGNETLTNAGGYDIFVAKYDAAGAVQWAKCYGGTGLDAAYSLCKDVTGNTYVTGGFYSPLLPIGTTVLSNNNGTEDIFIAKYDVSGNEQWALSASGNFHEFGNGICCDINDNVYVTGYFASTTLTLGMPLINNSTNSGSNVFLGKLSTGITSVYNQQPALKNDLVEIFPNPAKDICYVNLFFKENAFIKLYSCDGSLVNEITFTQSSDNRWILDSSKLSDGVYHVQAISEGQVMNGRLLVYH